MLVLIIAIIVASGLIAYGVSKSKAKAETAKEIILPVIEPIAEVQQKKELKLKERPKQEAKPKQKTQKPKQDAKPKQEVKAPKKEQKNKQKNK